jgi:hypothetical protein
VNAEGAGGLQHPNRRELVLADTAGFRLYIHFQIYSLVFLKKRRVFGYAKRSAVMRYCLAGSCKVATSALP